jgi:hypothetical protein
MTARTRIVRHRHHQGKLDRRVTTLTAGAAGMARISFGVGVRPRGIPYLREIMQSRLKKDCRILPDTQPKHEVAIVTGHLNICRSLIVHLAENAAGQRFSGRLITVAGRSIPILDRPEHLTLLSGAPILLIVGD